MTRYAALMSILLGAGILTYTLASAGFTSQTVFVALLGVAWFVLHARRMDRFTWIFFFLFSLVSIFVVWVGASKWLAIASLVFTLLAWDLSAFGSKLEGIPAEDVKVMEQSHFTRLAFVFGLGLVGLIVAGFVPVNLSLGSALMITLLGIWGVSTLVYHLRSRE